MATYKAEGVVLRTRKLGESDQICVIFSREEGKLSAVAKGARKAQSRLLAVAQVFTHGYYLLYRGRSLDTMTQGSVLRSFRPLRSDMERMAYASYACELVDVAVADRQPNDALFEALLSALTLFAEGDRPVSALHWFELRLLDALGYRPELESCVSCGLPSGDGPAFSIREGGILCARCRGRDAVALPVAPRVVAQMRHLLAAPARRIGILQIHESDRRQIQRLLRLYMDHHLERTVNSRSFLDVVQEMDSETAKGP